MAASAAGGGVFDLVGTVVGRIAGVVGRWQENAQQQARWKHEAALMELQMEARPTELAGQASLAQTAGAWQGFAPSMAAEAAIGDSYRWVNAVRALTRPLLTLLLWLITSLVYFSAAADARASIVETAPFAETAATLWSFGDRGNRREVR